MTTACAANNRPTLSPTKMAEFWRTRSSAVQRVPVTTAAGGAALALHSQRDVHVDIMADPSGFSPGLDVKDEQGREWSVKLGPEARTEVVASRIVWAMGYHQPPVYYLPRFALRDDGLVKTGGAWPLPG